MYSVFSSKEETEQAPDNSAAQGPNSVIERERERFKPKYKGQDAFIFEHGLIKQLYEPPTTTSETTNANVAPAIPPRTNLPSQIALGKRRASDRVESSYSRIPRPSGPSCPNRHLPATIDLTAENSSTATSSSSSNRMGPPALPSAARNSSTNGAPSTCLDPVGHMLFLKLFEPQPKEELLKELKDIYGRLETRLSLEEAECAPKSSKSREPPQSTDKLSKEQWQALCALHRTLLKGQHEFHLVYPSADKHAATSPALRKIATKYTMPARMWREGIPRFLELLTARLPDSLDHMLSFIYLAYRMARLLTQEVPEQLESWSECLEILSRYCTAIQKADARDLELWYEAVPMRHYQGIALDWTAWETLQERQRRLLTQADAVERLRAFARAEASSQPHSSGSSTPTLTKEVDCDDYMNAESRFELQVALFSRGCQSIAIEHFRNMKDPTRRWSKLELPSGPEEEQQELTPKASHVDHYRPAGATSSSGEQQPAITISYHDHHDPSSAPFDDSSTPRNSGMPCDSGVPYDAGMPYDDGLPLDDGMLLDDVVPCDDGMPYYEASGNPESSGQVSMPWSGQAMEGVQGPDGIQGDSLASGQSMIQDEFHAISNEWWDDPWEGPSSDSMESWQRVW